MTLLKRRIGQSRNLKFKMMFYVHPKNKKSTKIILDPQGREKLLQERSIFFLAELNSSSITKEAGRNVDLLSNCFDNNANSWVVFLLYLGWTNYKTFRKRERNGFFFDQKNAKFQTRKSVLGRKKNPDQLGYCWYVRIVCIFSLSRLPQQLTRHTFSYAMLGCHLNLALEVV